MSNSIWGWGSCCLHEFSFSNNYTVFVENHNPWRFDCTQWLCVTELVPWGIVCLNWWQSSSYCHSVPCTRPFTGEYNSHNEEGSYRCVVCGNRIFSSEDKFNAHCGWPSFKDVVSKDSVTLADDTSHGEGLFRNLHVLFCNCVMQWCNNLKMSVGVCIVEKETCNCEAKVLPTSLYLKIWEIFYVNWE